MIKYLGDPIEDMWQNVLNIAVNEIDACLVSNAETKRQSEQNDGAYLKYGYDVDADGFIRIPSFQRVISPEFVGPAKFLNLCFEFSFKVHKPNEHKLDRRTYGQHVKMVKGKNGNQFLHIERFIVLNYSRDTLLDDVAQLQQQIMRKTQVEQILALKDLYALNKNLVRGCQTVLLTSEMIEKRWKNGVANQLEQAISEVTSVQISSDLLTNKVMNF